MNSTFKNSLGNGKTFWKTVILIGLHPEEKKISFCNHFYLIYLHNVHWKPYWKYLGGEGTVCMWKNLMITEAVKIFKDKKFRGHWNVNVKFHVDQKYC